MELKKVVCKDGVYSWSCVTDMEFRQFEAAYAVRMGLGICAFMLLLGLLCLRDEMLLLMLLTCGIILLIVFAVSRIVMNLPGNETVPFEMGEGYIRLRQGRGSIFVNLKRVICMETLGNRIILHTRRSHIPVYLPQEDFDRMSGLIAARIEDSGRPHW